MAISAPFPAENENPWNTKIQAWADDVETNINGVVARVAEAPVATALGVYDRVRGVYNLKPKHLRRTRAMLARAKTGTATCTIAAIGDSTVGGVGAVPGVTSWPEQLGGLLVLGGYPSAGSGAVMAYKSSAKDVRLTIGAGWGALSAASNLLTNSTTSNPLLYTFTNTGTVVKVYYWNNLSGPFSVSIDGGSAVTVTPVGGASMGTYTVSGLTAAPHTVSIVRVSGNSQVLGAELTGTTGGVRILNTGIGGRVTASTIGTFNVENIVSLSTGFNSDLVLYMMETNDTPSLPVETYRTNVALAIERQKTNGSDVVIVTAVPSLAKDFTPYTAALYSIADEKDVPLIDIQNLWGDYATQNALGMMDDGLHPKPEGYQAVASLIMRALDL